MTKRILDVKGCSNGVLQPIVSDITLWNRMISDVSTNNTWCPDISRIIFNVGERDIRDKNGKKVSTEPSLNGKKVSTEPCLATTMFFNDNTKVTCINSVHDKITLVKDPETGVLTASNVDKERGILYCTVKKLISTIDPKTGEMKTEGFGRILHNLVKFGWDQKVELKKAELKKEAAKAKHEAEKANVKSKPSRNASLHDTVNHLADVVERLNSSISSAPASKKVAPKKVAPKKVAPKKVARKLKRNAKGQFI